MASGKTGSIIREFFPSTGVLTRTSSIGGGASVSQGQDLIIAPDGHALVTSAGDSRVMEFAADGGYVGDLVSSGTGGLSYPTGLIMTSAGTLLVSSRDTGEVLAYDGTTGASLGAFVTAGSGGLSGPFGLTFGPNGNLFVTGDTNEVLEYDGGSGAFVSVFVDAGDNGGLDQPRGLTFKADGNLLVASYGTDEVLEFDGTTGAPLGRWARVGTETAITQDSPWGIRVGPNGHVFVTRTGSDFSSGGGAQDDHDDTAQSHLTDARMFEYHVCTGAWRRTLIGGNDHGLDFATGFDFVPGFTIDCNQNQIQDDCDISSGFSTDGDSNGIPDECETDCNGNGTIIDQLDLIPFGTSYDCNCNFVPDECDIGSSFSHDCDGNGVPDECEDCNGNGFADACDISGGSSGDCNSNAIPDDCESAVDCDGNGEADICDLAVGTHSDCNANAIPDLCDAAGGGLILEVDFEDGLPVGWTTSGLFQVTASCPVSPSCNGSMWAYAGNIAFCGYGNNQESELTSPPIPLPPTNATLTFCSMIDTEAGFDFAEVHVNGDLLWQDSGGPRVWDEHTLDLTAYGGQTVTITFRLTSDTFVTDFGWQVDHIRLDSGSEDCNENGLPDECDTAGGAGDGNGNGIPDECEVGVPQQAPYPHDRRKNRYISFDPNKAVNDGKEIAFQVELKTLTLGSCNGNGGFCRVDRGSDDCKTCSVDGNPCINPSIDCAPDPPQACDSTGETCVNDAPDSGGSNVGRVWWVGPESPLNNDVHLMVSEPFRKISTDWPNPTHVGDCEIVPQAGYAIRAVSPSTGTTSAEIIVETTLYAPISASWWADCVGPLKRFCGGDIRMPQCTGDGDCIAPATCDPAWTLPDGAVNVDDITAILALVAPGPLSVPPDMTWVDLYGNASGAPGSQNFDPPDFVANVSDIGAIVFGFGGRPYTFNDPADCPDEPVWP